MRSSAILLALCLATPASAEQKAKPGTTEAVRQAKSHFKQGEAFVKQSLWDDAIREFEAAYELMPLPDLMFNIAQAYRQKGDPAARDHALDIYVKFVDVQPEGQAADEARTHIAYLMKDREVRAEEAKLRADEEAKRRAEEEQKRLAEARARARAEEEARLAEEARKRKVEEDARKAEEERRQAELARHRAIEQVARDKWNAERAHRTHRRHQGYVVGGIGLGCVAIAGVFGYLGASQSSAVQSGGFTTAAYISDAISTGKTYNTIGWGFGLTGLVGVAIGAPLVGMNWDRGDFKVVPTATAEFKGVTLTGVFR